MTVTVDAHWALSLDHESPALPPLGVHSPSGTQERRSEWGGSASSTEREW